MLINQEEIEQVHTFKYLGLYFYSQLRWTDQVEHVCLNMCQRLHFLRRLRLHGFNKEMMLLFYWASIESLIRYGITTWFGNLPVKQRTQLQNLIGQAGKIIGMPPPSSLHEKFEETVRRQGRKIAGDPNHVLSSKYQLLPSGKR